MSTVRLSYLLFSLLVGRGLCASARVDAHDLPRCPPVPARFHDVGPNDNLEAILAVNEDQFTLYCDPNPDGLTGTWGVDSRNYPKFYNLGKALFDQAYQGTFFGLLGNRPHDIALPSEDQIKLGKVDFGPELGLYTIGFDTIGNDPHQQAIMHLFSGQGFFTVDGVLFNGATPFKLLETRFLSPQALLGTQVIQSRLVDIHSQGAIKAYRTLAVMDPPLTGPCDQPGSTRKVAYRAVFLLYGPGNTIGADMDESSHLDPICQTTNEEKPGKDSPLRSASSPSLLAAANDLQDSSVMPEDLW